MAETLKCAVCPALFVMQRKNQVTCSTKCSQSRYTKMPDVPLECAECHVEFHGHPRRKFCKEACRVLYYEKCYETAPRLTDTSLYVYLWFDKGAQLPYYVGSGGGTRSHDQHGNMRMPHAVVIARSGLTGEGALLIESTLIEFCLLLGAKLENTHNPLVRQERPPLTI